MCRYWVIAPYDSRDDELWDAVWNANFEHGFISIGWGALGDVSLLDERQIRELICRTWPNCRPGTATYESRTLHKFFNHIRPGDRVIARRGRKRIAGVGTVRTAAYFEQGKVKRIFEESGIPLEPIAYPNHLNVEWDESQFEIEFDSQVFGMTTMYELSEEDYRRFAEDEADPLPSDEFESSDVAESPTVFALERYLEDFIVSNFDKIFHGKLVQFEDPEEGVVGQQYHTDIGVIDILAQDPMTSDFVVIELKRGQVADKVVGQILRYMGWVKSNLCDEGQRVRGIIISGEEDAKLSYAVQMVDTVVVKYYRVSFELQDQLN